MKGLPEVTEAVQKQLGISALRMILSPKVKVLLGKIHMENISTVTRAALRRHPEPTGTDAIVITSTMAITICIIAIDMTCSQVLCIFFKLAISESPVN